MTDKLMRVWDVLKERKIRLKGNSYKIHIVNGRNITIKKDDKPNCFAYGTRGNMTYCFIKRSKGYCVLRVVKWDDMSDYPFLGARGLEIIPSDLVVLHKKHWNKYDTQRLLDCIDGNPKDTLEFGLDLFALKRWLDNKSDYYLGGDIL